MSPEWRQAGELLGLSNGRLEGIAMMHHDVQTCWREIMIEWLCNSNDTYNYPASWQGLCKLLDHMKLSSISREVSSAILQHNL